MIVKSLPDFIKKEGRIQPEMSLNELIVHLLIIGLCLIIYLILPIIEN